MMRRRGFTLIELLVVVAIIALLIAILIPSLRKARESALRTGCGTHLKTQGTAFALYANQYSDKLPSMPGGNWLHDVADDTCKAMIGVSQTNSLAGLSETSIRKWFYCPSNEDANTDQAWLGSTGTGSGGFRFLDYAYFNLRGIPVTLPVNRRSGKLPPINYYTNWTQ